MDSHNRYKKYNLKTPGPLVSWLNIFPLHDNVQNFLEMDVVTTSCGNPFGTTLCFCVVLLIWITLWYLLCASCTGACVCHWEAEGVFYSYEELSQAGWLTGSQLVSQRGTKNWGTVIHHTPLGCYTPTPCLYSKLFATIRISDKTHSGSLCVSILREQLDDWWWWMWLPGVERVCTHTHTHILLCTTQSLVTINRLIALHFSSLSLRIESLFN